MRSFSSLDLRKQLLLLVALIFLPILGILLYTGFHAYENARSQTERDVRHLIQRFSHAQVDIIDQTRQLLELLSQVPDVTSMDLPACNAFLEKIHSNHTEYTTIVVADKAGVIECCAIPLEKPIHVADRGWFKRISQKKEFIIDNFLISRSSQKASLPFAYPILETDGTLRAAVGAAFDLAWYKKIFDAALLPKGSVILITDGNGTLLYQFPEDKTSLGKTVSGCRGFNFPGTRRGSLRVDDIDGTDREYWFERISVGQESNQLCLLIGIPEQAMLSGARKALVFNLTLLGMVATTSMAIAWFFGNHLIFTPIQRLLDRTRLIREGDFRISDAEERFPGELGMLARAFDDMAAALARREKDRDDAYRIINSSPVIGFIWKNETGWPVAFVTDNVAPVLGYTADDLTAGRATYRDFVHPDDLARVEETIQSVSTSIDCRSFAHAPYRIFTRAGELRWVDHRVAIERDDAGRITRYYGILLDITEHKMAEEEIRHLRNNLSDIINSMPSALIGVDRKGRVTQWNDGASSLTGVFPREALGHSLDSLFPRIPQGLGRISGSLERAMKDRQTVREIKVPVQWENESRYEDITVFPLSDVRMGGAVIRIDDVTEKMRMEEILIQNEKMLSVGGLAAGMAHEINNPLAGVIQNIHVLENRISNPAIRANTEAADAVGTTMETISAYMDLRGIPRILTAVKNSGDRMAAIVRNMLSFARKEGASLSFHNPVTLLDNTLELAATDYDLKRQYDFKSIVIEKAYERNLPEIRCEGSKLQQVLLNILNNGAHAMFERKKAPGAPAPKFILRLSHDKAEQMLQINIIDNGTGIDPAIRKKIFDPFFTTKPVGTGTGLGLSVSYFIITEHHNGTMDVVSTPGQGANFIIRLPLGPAAYRS